MRLIGRLSQHSRGVGSIIGSVFVALILLSGFAFYAVTQDITQHYNNTMSSMNDLDWNRNQENIVIKQIGITGTNKLNVTAENDGSIQSHLIWLGIFNTTVTPQNQTYQALSEFIAPGETDNVVSNSTVTVGNKYVIQLVTELGNTVESKFYPASNVSCALTLVATPPTVYQGNNVTVLLTVTLNDTVVDSIQSLTVALNATPANLVQLVGNSSLSVSGLARGTSAFFSWIYNTIDTGTVVFNATYSPASAGAYASANVNILASLGQGGGNVSIAGTNSTAAYNPSSWNPPNSTQLVSGSLSNLTTDDGVYMIFRSYQSQTSGQALYAHQETTTIGSTTYYLSKLNSSDTTGTDLSNSTSATGRRLFGRFAYSLSGVSSIPSSTWTIYYRSWLSNSGPTCHDDVDILIRQSDGAVRMTVATDVANSSNLSTTQQTLSGTYTFPSYVVVNQTDYLELDYYVHVATSASRTAYLRIDDSTLGTTLQTRAANVFLPSEYTAEVEFLGVSNTKSWTQLVWTIDSSFDTSGVNATFQLYNYAAGPAGAYPTGGDGYITVTLGTANVTETQAITINPTQFRDASGNWKMKIKGVKPTSTQFLMNVDWIELQTTYSATGDTVPYGVWQWYSLKATSANGGPIPYAYVSIYANGTSIAFRNATDKSYVTNPAWVRLDAAGEYQLEARSTSGSAETFVLYAVVGSVVEQKTIAQEAP
jgi:hypothetical protein